MRFRLLSSLILILSLTPVAFAQEALLIALPGEVRPIAIWDQGTQTFQPPPRTAAAQNVLGESLSGQKLSTYYSGEERNIFNVKRFHATTKGCTGSGRWSGLYRNPFEQIQLAFTPGFPGIRNFIGAFPGKPFAKKARQLSAQAYQRHGVSQTGQLKILKIQSFTLNNGLRQLFAVQSEIPGQGACPDHTLLLIGEKVGRYYRTRLERYRKNKKDCGRYFFVSTFATSRMIDKLVIMGQQDNARWYDLFHFAEGQTPKQIFHGGGASMCKSAF